MLALHARLLILALAPAHQSPESDAPGRVILPPREYRAHARLSPRALADQHLSGLVTMQPRGRRVEIQWFFYEGVAVEGAKRRLEVFELPYWPTALAEIPDDRLDAGEDLLVAGKRPADGHTILERWDLTTTLASEPGLEPPLVTSAIVRTVLYDADVVGLRVVRYLAPTLGVSDVVFAHFDDSGDFYRLDARSGDLRVLITPTDLPEIRDRAFNSMWGARLANGGYSYVYQYSNGWESEGDILLLTDHAGRGWIDAWRRLDPDYWGVIAETRFAEETRPASDRPRADARSDGR